jgi:hypothetical protein
MSFRYAVSPFAKGLGIIEMKVYFRGMATQLPWYKSVKPFVYYALSQPISTVVIGCDSLSQFEENVAIASGFRTMASEELDSLTKRVSPFTRSLMYYKP